MVFKLIVFIKYYCCCDDYYPLKLDNLTLSYFFFLLSILFCTVRGMTRDHAVEFLTLAFQTQRPTIHRKSANFRKIF